MRNNARNGLATSDWVTTEVSAARSMKVRGRSVTLDERGTALADFAQLRRSLLTNQTILPGFFETAARLADRHDTKLRSGDALHLAICLHYRHSLCTLDAIMADAAPMLGLKSHLL